MNAICLSKRFWAVVCLGGVLSATVVAHADPPAVRAYGDSAMTFEKASGQSTEAPATLRSASSLRVYSTAAFEADAADDGDVLRYSFGPGFFASGFEPPCDPNLNGNGYIGGGGSGAPQNCDWHASTAAQPGYMEPHIDTVLPFNGAQHLRFQYDPNQPTGLPDQAADPGSRNWAFSDDITPVPAPGVVHLDLNIRISGIAEPGLNENAYIIQPQTPTNGALTTVFTFNETGTISVGDDGTGCGDNLFNIVDTGVPWIVDGAYHNVHICLDTINDRIRYFYDGNFIYSTGLGEGGLGGPAGCGVFAGNVIEHVLIRYEANANDGSIVDVDDVEIAEGDCLEPTGACCMDTNPDTCMSQGQDTCEMGGGVFTGVGTECTDPVGNLCDLAFVCEGAAGGCFEEHGTPGCDDLVCCVDVCSSDSFCCEVEWDGTCVTNAEASEACLPPSICPNCNEGDCINDTSCQQLSVANASNATAEVFDVADGFTPTADGVVNSICWNGAYLPGTTITDDFTVTYYDCDETNNPGVPNMVIGGPFSQSGGTLIHNPATQKINTGLAIPVVPPAPIFEYHATHADVPVEAGQRYFIEIVNATVEGESWFWQFAVDPEGDGESFQKSAGLMEYARYDRILNDKAFCLNIDLGDQSAVCPLPPPEPCQLDVAEADVEENEPCQSDPDMNLACSDDPPGPFTELGNAISTDPAMPTLIHGNAWAETDALPEQDRDVDWYRFTAPAGVDTNGDGEVFACLAIASELPMQGNVFPLMNGQCDPAAAGPGLDAVGFNCGSLLAVGYPIPNQSTQAILMRTADAGAELFDGFPCGGGGACPGDCSDDAGQPDGQVGIQDLLDLLAQWGGAGTCDIDGGGISITDLLALLASWGQCPSAFGNDYLIEIAIVDTFEECFPDEP